MESAEHSARETRLQIVGTFAGSYGCSVEAALDTGLGLEFTGHLEVDARLTDFLRKMVAESASADVFDVFPDIVIKAPTITYRSMTATLLIRFETDIMFGDDAKLGLAFAFGKIGAEAERGEQPAKRNTYVVGIRSTTPIPLEKIGGKGLTIIGKLLGDFGVNHIGVFYSSDDTELALFEGDDPGQVRRAKGLSFSTRFGTSDSYKDIALPPPRSAEAVDGADLTSSESETAPARHGEGASPEDKRMRKWFKVQKTFGPLELRRVGGEWHEGKLGFLLDAGIELLGLKVALAGLRVSVEPGKLAKLKAQDLELGLDGLEIGYKGGPVSISGAFLRTPGGAFSGMALIRAESFMIAALGSYDTTEKGDPSLFIFGAYVGTIGGPACFVVQGLAAGFGYNRGLTVPKVEDVRDFPLVSLVLSPPSDGSTNMLEQLGGDHFPTVQGQYWIAAGVKFTSFKLIDAFALLTIQFGVRFELALLGVATIQQPPNVTGAKPFVYVELALSVRVAPDDGLFAARAVLTSNSYLFDKRCKLTGGFAFCIWFRPTNPAFADHSGDFVLTLGGYHPRFNAPAHYPQVPRIGFNWQLPDQGVTIKGECYFALTSSCIMAGCRLTAIYRSGDFVAWFEAYADFLMAWEPFHYEADIGIWIGASYTSRAAGISSTISFQLGASLSIWGPEFAGVASIDLGIFAVTVHIGAAADKSRIPPRIEWPEFCAKFIPHVDDKPAPLGIFITGGLLREDKAKGWFIVNAAELSLTVDSYIPATMLLIGKEPLTGGKEETKLGIRPMAEQSIDSKLHVHFWNTRNQAELIPVRPDAITKGVPEALWSPQPAPSSSGNRPIPAPRLINALSGVRLIVGEEMKPSKEAKASWKVRPVSRRCTRAPVPARLHDRQEPSEEQPDDREEARKQQKAREQLRERLISDSGVRRKTVTALRSLGFDLSPEAIDLEQTARCVLQQDVLLAPPLFVTLGEPPPSPLLREQ